MPQSCRKQNAVRLNPRRRAEADAVDAWNPPANRMWTQATAKGKGKSKGKGKDPGKGKGKKGKGKGPAGPAAPSQRASPPRTHSSPTSVREESVGRSETEEAKAREENNEADFRGPEEPARLTFHHGCPSSDEAGAPEPSRATRDIVPGTVVQNMENQEGEAAPKVKLLGPKALRHDKEESKADAIADPLRDQVAWTD